MTRTSDVNEPRLDMCSDDVVGLLTRWKEIDCAGAELVRCEDESAGSGQAAGALTEQFSDLSVDLAREQLAVLQDLAAQPAACMGDIMAKLRIWASLTCPTPSDVPFLQPADRLVLSIYNDLERMVA